MNKITSDLKFYNLKYANNLTSKAVFSFWKASYSEIEAEASSS